MKRIVIIGCGFAGLSAARAFAPVLDEFRVTVIDRHPFMHYRPLLPDIISGIIEPDRLLSKIETFARRYGFSFVRAEVEGIDFESKQVAINQPFSIPYDYLIIAAGSETNFHGQADLARRALKLDTVGDAKSIQSSLSAGGYDHVAVCGGGYTGIEAATHIRRFFDAHGTAPRITVVEMLDSIVSALPRWMRAYVEDNLRRMDIQTAVNTRVEDYNHNTLQLSDGRRFEKTLLVWTAGMKASSFVAGLGAETGPQGRLIVDETLSVRDRVYAAGNVACYRVNDGCARMAAQMALAQGKHAAANIKRHASAASPVAFRPVDSGYLAPMANWRSCGVLFGAPLSGSAATAAHYIINAYRVRGLHNKARVLFAGLRSRQTPEERFLRI